MTSPNSITEMNKRVQSEAEFVQDILAETNRIIVGQQKLIQRMLIALLSNGHILIEGVPGLAKTLAVRTLSETVGAQFQRIQFTPDLLPADLVGTQIYNPTSGDFTPRLGPVFSNIVLADEINRAPAKVQSALLEAMEERQVTIGETTFALEKFYMVLATQNPIEQEGTYNLPEAQLDRFMLKVVITYPSRQEEQEIINRMTGRQPDPIQQVVDKAVILRARDIVRDIYVDDKIKQYVLDLIFATRYPEESGLSQLAPLINVGVSPRATLFLIKGAKAHAFLRGRGYVKPDDVKALAVDVMRHRIGISFEAQAQEVTSEQIIYQILKRVDVP
jgi:MoxR-like ATPase